MLKKHSSALSILSQTFCFLFYSVFSRNLFVISILPDTLELRPGLTKKPPLPKKAEHLICSQMLDLDVCNRTDEITDFLSLKYTLTKNKENDYLEKSPEISQDIEVDMASHHRKRNNMVSPMEETKYIQSITNHGYNYSSINDFNEPNFIEKNMELYVIRDPESAKDSQCMAFENDIIFQNWVEDVIQKESQTDKYLDDLKKEHVLTNYNLTDNTKIVSSLSWTDEDKLPNISDIDLDSLFIGGNETLKSLERNMKPPNVNSTSQIVGKNKRNEKHSISNDKLNQRSQNKSYQTSKGFNQTPCDSDIDNWMNQSEEKQFTTRNTSRTKSTYVDILKNLEEMENQTTVEMISAGQEPAQQDTEGKCSRSESMDNIVSILEVLENENKKSRKYI